MILRFLNIQGIAGITASFALAILLIIAKGETRHWKKASAEFELLYHREQAAFAGTIANYRAAADQARATDRAAAEQVADEQRAINERTEHEFQDRLAAARAHAERLRVQSKSAADSGSRGAAPMPGFSAAPGGAAQAASDRLPLPDALVATEQAIQLDELIKWVRQQHAVRVDGVSGERPQGAEAQSKVDNNAVSVGSSSRD